MGLSSPKITIHFLPLAPISLSAASASAPPPAPAALFCRLSFSGDGRDLFFAKLQTALKQAAWRAVPPSPLHATASATGASAAATAAAAALAASASDLQKDKEFSTTSAGIRKPPLPPLSFPCSFCVCCLCERILVDCALAEGIIRKVKTAQAASDKTAEEAFKDLDALMQRAQELVPLCTSFAFFCRCAL